jgi:hypothetical protein
VAHLLNTLKTFLNSRRLPTLASAGVTALLLLPGCAHPQGAEFDSPETAAQALAGALRTHDTAQLSHILGPDSDKLLASGDEVADQNGAKGFVTAFDVKHSFTDESDGTKTLVVGESDWPMPIPLVPDGKVWRFDTAAGLDELISRRIGRNELDAIEVCQAIVDAQRDYAYDNSSGTSAYAQMFMSDPGKTNGLYWPQTPGGKASPLGELAAEAAAEGYKQPSASGGGPRPYHGYYYRILTAQGPDAPGGAMSYLVGDQLIGGFAVIAYPAEYGNSGVKSFIVNHTGVVYESDLGSGTANTAKGMTAYNPGKGWTKSE